MYCNDNQGWFPTCAYAQTSAFVQYPEDWVHWQANRNLEDSAIVKYVGRGEKLVSLLRCPADTFDGRRTLQGISHGQGPYLYSYMLNARLAMNVRLGVFRTKLGQWRKPSNKIMMTEGWERFPTPGWEWTVPLTQRHGSSRFHGNVGNPVLYVGAMAGANVSAAFVDGHAEAIDQNFAYRVIHDRPRDD
jgi:hypothetical protein